MALSYTGAGTRTACWEERPQVCGEIRPAVAEVRRRTPLAGLHGTPGGRCSGPSSMGPRQALLLLLLLLPSPPHLRTCPPYPPLTPKVRGGNFVRYMPKK